MGRTFTRRELLGNAGLYGLGAIGLGSLTDPARLARSLAQQKAAKLARPYASSPTPGPLVIGTLYGGYDGVNLVAPFKNTTTYLALRPTMNISTNAIDL
ncbi:MAG TPA: hypothetical protein VMD59_14995, partial [Acidimicrobiales bacterium]|nr:hypothetical protein [Acidimicrobiales bacterium]